MKWWVTSNRSHRSATFVRLRPNVDISFTALLYFGSTLFIGVAAMNSQTNLLFGLFGLMIGVLLVAGFVSRFSLRRINIRRAIPERMVVGEPTDMAYTVTNGKSYWPSVSLSLGELDGCEAFERQPYGYLLHAAPGSTADVAIALRPKRRGLHELARYQISTSFPFGFVKRAVTNEQKDTFVVFPALAQVDPSILLLCESAESAGARMRPQKGGTDEFYGLREYRMGENPKLIHWRTSARTGDLVIREMTRVSPPRLLLIVDNHRSSDGDARNIERTLAMAASVASLALGRGYAVGLMAYSRGWLHIPPSQGKRHRRELLSTMAQMRYNSEHSVGNIVDEAIPLAGLGTTILVFTPGLASTPALRRRSRIVTLATNDAAVQRYFNFDKAVDFSHCMPLEQESADFRAATPALFADPEGAVNV